VVMSIQRSLGNLVLVRLIVPFGTLAIAANTLCERIDMGSLCRRRVLDKRREY